jgi:hypothetical protein
VWVAEYVKDMNGTRAARVAGYGHPAVAAAKLLNPALYPHVAAEVRRRPEAKRRECMSEARQLIEELARIAFFNPKDLFAGGKPVPLHQLPDDVAGAVARWDAKEYVAADGSRVRRYSFRGHNKPAALRLMALLLGHRPARFSASPGEAEDTWTEISKAELREAVLSLVRAADGTLAEDVKPLFPR